MTSKLKVEQIAHTNNVSAMTINSSGIVTKPAHPAFMAGVNNSIPLTTSYAELANVYVDVNCNVGSHYDSTTGRFTVPVTGVYNFGFASIGNSTGTVYRFRPYKNGSSLHNYELRIDTTASGSEYGTNGEFSFTELLTAGDYVSLFGKSDNGTDPYGDTAYRYSYFRGHLIG
tara:strand:+ start:4368 stop:4883 length:516 start_codon:yes stop_codon:yes gene_type:complete